MSSGMKSDEKPFRRPSAACVKNHSTHIPLRQEPPKLGDFTKLQHSSIYFVFPSEEGGCKPISSSTHPKETCINPPLVAQELPNQLGNFSELVNQLRTQALSQSASSNCTSSISRSSDNTCERDQSPDSRRDSANERTDAFRLELPLVIDNGPSSLAWNILTGEHQREASNPVPFKSNGKKDAVSSADKRDCINGSFTTLQYLPIVPDSRMSRETMAFSSKKNSHLNKSDRLVPSYSPLQADCSNHEIGYLFSYQLIKHGPTFPVYDKVRTEEEKHKSLSNKLARLLTSDASVKTTRPLVASHGVHVFLDMSNINISFQKAVRARHAIHERARFVPLPHLNLQFLNEILVRRRKTTSLYVGCSTLPGRREPRYVEELRHLGYQVDLRERKPVQPTHSPCWKHSGSSSDEMYRSLITRIRYVEDLVDETLQTRIGEAVMKHFQEPGTLIFATGDAQPAKYSDGFFTYAERALRMGWNVEVVSWSSSLSSNWQSREWASQWGDRFRLIELDEFMDDLLT